MTGIFYFSATGNSLYIAQKIKESTLGKIIYIPSYSGNGSEFEKIIIVSPIYSFGVPKPVFDFIPTLNKNSEVYIILNYGGMCGGADYFIYCYAKENNLNIKSVHTVKMVENFTLTFSVPAVYSRSTLKAAPKKIKKIIEKIIANDSVIPKKKKTKADIYLKNKDSWHTLANDFFVSDDCVLCNKCVQICPVSNISVTDGKISFSDKCIACLGCYHRCPQKAIRYKNKIKKDRYINPFINPADIGRTFD